MCNDRSFFNESRGSTYVAVKGIIVEIQPAMTGGFRMDGCVMFVSLEDDDGNIVNFIIPPTAYIVDFVPLQEGMRCTFFYHSSRPAPLIYPPQHQAAVVAPDVAGRNVSVGHFNNALINEERTLQLNMDSSVCIHSINNNIFMGSPANHDLVVLYETSTRSIPAQTTPKKVIVLCGV